MTRRRALWLTVASLLLAALLRLSQLSEFPPGLHYDEAANAILAGDIGLRGARPVFISSYTGKEVLFFYAAGLLMRLVGETVFALRLTAAFFALLTVAATYWLGRALLADRRIAVLAAALLAINFWHLVLSRLGFRAISEPLLQALTVAALFQGLKMRDHWRWFAVSGLFLGLTGYTYLAARLFPILLLLSLVPVLFTNWYRRRRWSQLALTGAVGLVVIAPLLLYFYQHPDAFWVRIQQVAPEGDGGMLGENGVFRNYLRSLAMFFLVGDPYWRFNLPGRPLFNWLYGGLLLAGWLIALRRWRRWWYDWQKSAVLLLLLTPFLMILPTALAVNEIVPSNLRAIGLIPFIFFLPALGLVTLLEQLADLFRRPRAEAAAFLRALGLLEGYNVNYAFIVLLILLLGGAFTGQAYFEEWATRTDLFYESDSDLVAVADYLDENLAPDTTVYVSALHYRHPTIAFLSKHYERIKWLPRGEALVFPEEGPSLHVYPHSLPAPAWVKPYLDGAQQTEGPEGPDQEPLYTAYHFAQPPNPLPAPAQNIQGHFADVIELTGYDLKMETSGNSLALTLFWKIHSNSNAPLRPFIHLEDHWGSRWSQVEPFVYAAEQWTVGETVIQHVRLPIEPGTPPGPYRLRIGIFNNDTGERLTLVDEEGRLAGDAVVVEQVALGPRAAPATLPDAPRGVPQSVRPGLQLLGYARSDAPVATGTKLPLTLWWYATEPQPDLTVRLELLRQDNTGIILLDTKPVHEIYPFHQWTVPLFLRDEITPQFPLDLEGGNYRLHVRILDENGESIFASSLGTVTVEETKRRYEAPDTAFPLAATFSNEIKLIGYNMEPVAQGRFRLELVWQTVEPPREDYTVFVHVLQGDGTCCLWQQDVMPQQGAYPTSRWVPGEIVVDEYIIEFPADTVPGTYLLEVGLYVAETGQRLRVTQPNVPEDDVIYLRPLSLE